MRRALIRVHTTQGARFSTSLATPSIVFPFSREAVSVQRNLATNKPCISAVPRERQAHIYPAETMHNITTSSTLQHVAAFFYTTSCIQLPLQSTRRATGHRCIWNFPRRDKLQVVDRSKSPLQTCNCSTVSYPRPLAWLVATNLTRFYLSPMLFSQTSSGIAVQRTRRNFYAHLTCRFIGILNTNSV
jgi:hypothetical protein